MSTAVLLSGGLDSAVLAAEAAASGEMHPVYVAVGLAWEAAERAIVAMVLAAARPESRAAMARALSLGLAHPLQIDAPYADVSKAEVIRRGAALGVPFELTLSCMNPPANSSDEKGVRPLFAMHCGECSKCR